MFRVLILCRSGVLNPTASTTRRGAMWSRAGRTGPIEALRNGRFGPSVGADTKGQCVKDRFVSYLHGCCGPVPRGIGEASVDELSGRGLRRICGRRALTATISVGEAP